jgi:glucose/arabinose dehydrogenase
VLDFTGTRGYDVRGVNNMGRSIRVGTLVLFIATSRTLAVTLDLQLVTGSVTKPVFVTHAGDNSGRLFIVEQSGTIKIFDLNNTNLLAAPFLNITNLTLYSGEQGLLSVAFHPGYKTNGNFYVYFTNPDGSSNVVARFMASPPNANTVNTNTMQTVLCISHPSNDNHNGGQLQFGPDGYLYIGTGDGGSGCDPPNNAQNLGVLLGKMLRIDVNNFTTNYTIPPSNPFIATTGALPEIWAYGLRNPWRFSFDRLTGDLFIGDVGEGAHEEVDLQPANSTGGENYGWRLYEGFGTNTCSVTFSNVPAVLPIIDYDHSSGRCAVIGGYRYRGTKIPPLYGTYLYADFCDGQVYGAITNLSGGWTTILTNDTGFTVTTFGEDEAGEVYLSRSATAGSIYRIVWKDTDGDGMADDWEQQYFGSATSAVANADPDSDGFSNLQESLADTNPTNAASALRITSVTNNRTNGVVNFTSATNKLYQLQRSDDLMSNSWTTVTNNVTGTGGIIPLIDVDVVGITQRFYRVHLLP